ncbi:excalibur calcium-binding domain-containing protein [Volucribacter psittacicida]|uniref:excalibur calcium-binding domain-containing protein n=1 Tax=Volucribacter psittacicida TaxID=203482 RepID=UPI00104DA02E|nr:excalibur calcium-binding domain-containing protein [Volucribacter psittacicida]
MYKKAVILLGLLLIVPISEARKARCADFATQAEAQAYMERYGAYYLDRDRDGEPCECLPGGSKYGSSVCRR